MMRSSGLAILAMLAGFSSAAAQRSTITRDAFRPRADSLVFTDLAESRAPSASFAVDSRERYAGVWRARSRQRGCLACADRHDDLRDRIDHEAVHGRCDHEARSSRGA